MTENISELIIAWMIYKLIRKSSGKLVFRLLFSEITLLNLILLLKRIVTETEYS